MLLNDPEENYQTGFIAIYRSLQRHWIWDDEKKLKWWLDILLTVNHKDSKVNIGNALYECKRGQSLLSLQSWGKRWGVDKSSVKRFMDLLKKDEMIVIENVQKTTRITVCKYDSYNRQRNATETQQKRNRNATETKAHPNNNDNNVNNENNDKKKVFAAPSIDEVIEYFKLNGYKEQTARKAFEYYNVADWKDSKGNQVKNWKQKMQAVWFKEENLIPLNNPKLVW